MKQCSKCKRELPLDNFHSCPTRKDSLNHKCKDCANEGARASYKKHALKAKERAADSRDWLYGLISEIKSKYSCCICGEKEGCCLDFHHINDDKLDSVSEFVQKKSPQAIFDEINKCVVVCANCHRKIHIKNLPCPEQEVCKENILDYFDFKFNRFRKKQIGGKALLIDALGSYP
jgi:predicted DNA-binding protein YlxM (UPF0122 family)